MPASTCPRARALLIVFVSCLVASGQTAGCRDAGGARGHGVSATWDERSIESTNADEATTAAILDALVGLRSAWLRRDVEAYLSGTSTEVSRFGLLRGRVAVGHAEIREDLPAEWDAFERTKGGELALRLRVRRARVHVEGDTAELSYWLEATGGSRWDFSDLAAVFEVYQRKGESWELLHQSESWGLTYDVERGLVSEREPFEFDFVHPVVDVDRAVAFYAPLIGEPESVRADWATFNLRGRRFHLDGSDLLRGHARVRVGLPNGYAMFYTHDLDAERARLADLGADVSPDELTLDADRGVLVEDPGGNLFVVLERRFDVEAAGEPDLSGLESDAAVPTEVLSAVRDLWTSWATQDRTRVTDRLAAEAEWFDSTRAVGTGVVRGRSSILTELESDWARFDRGALGLRVRLSVEGLRAMQLVGRTLVTYRLERAGLGRHHGRDIVLVSHVLDGLGRFERTFVVGAGTIDGQAREVDYVGYPQTNMREAQAFYRRFTQSDDPYFDVGWVGFWSRDAVFGIFEAKQRRDGVPELHRANGYVSFWVRSADQTLALLAERGAGLPRLPAINSRSGIDDEPGYRQIYATDSEGNGVVFTEYTGD